MLPSISQRWRIMAVVLAALTLLVSVTTALEVTPGSPCSSVCMDRSDGDRMDPNGSTTNVTDIVCEDIDYTNSFTGRRFKECMDCLHTSRNVSASGTESDTWWYLYNLRYAASVCLFNFPGSTRNRSSPCDIPYSCGGLKNVMKTDALSPAKDQLNYCATDNNLMTSTYPEGVFYPYGNNPVRSCAFCLQTTGDMKYMGNFMVALDAGCQQKPKAGDLLGLTGTMFNSFAINVTSPPVLETGPPPPSGTSLDMGTIIGIAVGAALLLIGGVALFAVYWRKNKRNKANEKRMSAGGPSPTGGSSITALTIGGGGPGSGGLGSGGGRHGYTMDYKKEIGLTSIDSHHNGTSNADYYDQFEAQQAAIAAKYGMLGVPGKAGSNMRAGAMPAHPAYIPRTAITSSNPHSQRASTDSRGSGNSRNTANYAHSQSLAAQQLQQQQRSVTPARSTPRATPEPISITSSNTASRSQPRYHRTTNSDNSYAMQQYLSQSDDATMPPPPPGPPPPAAITSHARSASAATSSSQQPPIDLANLPPPPPPQAKIPSLVLPSVPRIRMPKKYSPPAISVEEATPIDGQSHENITGPMDLQTDGHGSRFPDESLGQPRGSHESGNTSDRSGVSDRIVRQTVADRRRYEEAPIASGKTRLYG